MASLRQRVSVSGGIALASVAIAVFSLVFTMQRANKEDEGQLRSELTSILRRVTVLNSRTARTQADQDELVALVGQARAIFPQLDSVPAVYYRGVATAMENAYYYGEALKFADKAVRQAADDGNLLEQIYARRVKAATYIAIQDSRKTASEYRLAIALSDKALGQGPDHISALQEKLITLEAWGNAEARFDHCDRAATFLDSAVRLAGSNSVLRSRWLTRVESSRDRARETCNAN